MAFNDFSNSCWIITFSLIFGFESLAQNFNLRHDPFGQLYGESGWSIEGNADSLYLIFASAPFHNDTMYYSSVVTSVVLDGMGNVSMVDRVVDPLHATYPGWSNGADRLTNGGFVIGGSNFRTDSLDNWIQRPVLYFFSANGEYDSFIELGPEDQEWIGRQAKQTPDGGFVICGDAFIAGNQSDGFVIKTDQEGQQEWMQMYGGGNLDLIMSIGLRTDGGYYTGGYKYFSLSNQRLWAQALNDTGGVIWEKVWGPMNSLANAHLSSAADGHALIASGWGVGSGNSLRHYLAKLHMADGETIWQQQYGSAGTENVFYVVQEILPGGDLIAAGGHRASLQTYGAMLRTTSTGDSLWMRYYQYSDSIVSDKQGLFRDVQPTPDGGFIACGTALAVPGSYSQDVWVVKVDQHGCLEPGCQIITGMETQITNMREVLRVWPNPVQRSGPINIELALPDHFIPEGQLRITLTSSDGSLVHEERISNSSAASILQLPQLSTGVYHVHLSDATRWISGAKLILE